MPAADRVYNVLFLCTGNSARSVLGEAVLNHVGGGRFLGFSAGSMPKGQVHPMTLEILRDAGIPTEGLRSKSWEEFAGPGAPKMDFVFTVCDNAAGETCPIWPGQPMTAHWGIEDPAAGTGPDFRQRQAFEDEHGEEAQARHQRPLDDTPAEAEPVLATGARVHREAQDAGDQQQAEDEPGDQHRQSVGGRITTPAPARRSRPAPWPRRRR